MCAWHSLVHMWMTHICVWSLTHILNHCCSDRQKAWMAILQTTTRWEWAALSASFFKSHQNLLDMKMILYTAQTVKVKFPMTDCWCIQFAHRICVSLSFSGCIGHVCLHLPRCNPSSSSSSSSLPSAQPGPSPLLVRAHVDQTLFPCQ